MTGVTIRPATAIDGRYVDDAVMARDLTSETTEGAA
jgi:hypothetical protein